MQLKTRLKISSVNSLTDGRYFAAVGAEWIGFELTEGAERFVSPESAHEIMNWLAGPRFVGQYNDATVDKINENIEHLKLDIIQTNIDLDLNSLSGKVQSIIKEIEVKKETSFDSIKQVFEEQKQWTSQFLLNFCFSWDEMKNSNDWSVENLKMLCEIHPTFIKLDFTEDNLLEILEQVEPFGIDLIGGNEIKTGLQVFDDVQALIELLEIE